MYYLMMLTTSMWNREAIKLVWHFCCLDGDDDEEE